MQFEDLQVIWNSQDDERLFAIDESALHAAIKRKSRSVNRLLAIFEWVMIAVNLLVAVVLFLDAGQDNGPAFQYVLVVMYLAYFVVAVVRRLTRRREEVRFPPTMLGELDKAIWQVDYLIQQARSIIFWYVIPLGVVVTISMILSINTWWGLFFFTAWTTVTYFGSRWEINKWYRPKKENLELLREKLILNE